MRILEGKYRKLPLQSMLSPKVRPTARRMRELLFEFLGPRIVGARFLDLCAGSGAVGIEALSRGASHVTFVDRSRKMCGFIESNLERCGIQADQVEVIASDAAGFLRLAATLKQRLPWDVAFFDPPYEADYSPALQFFGGPATLSRRRGVLVVEHHCEKQIPESLGILRRWRAVRLGESCMSFYDQK